MEIKFSPRNKFTGRGPCIELNGNWVTKEVWEAVAMILGDCYMDSPFYKARVKAHAFFQSGYDRPDGEYILIECWADQNECDDLLVILNTEINKVIEPYRKVICVVAKTMNVADVKYVEDAVELIVDDTKCPMGTENEAVIHRCRSLFKPVDNVQYSAVLNHLYYTFQIKPLMMSK